MITLVYILITFSVFLEFALVTLLSSKKQFQKIVPVFSVSILSTTTAFFLLANRVSPVSVVLATISLFRVINMGRVIKGRMHADELKRRTFRTTLMLGVLTQLSVAGHVITYDYNFTADNLLIVLAVTQVIVALLLAVSVMLTKVIYRQRSISSGTEKMPTVTICIPARNETRDLPGCIESALASLYPKLEILVLDDCSHDKTPQIIKKYAHSGVRFIKGKIPSDDWVAKNSAYARLAQEAKGDILLFLGVDIRLQPKSVNEIVMQMRNKNMISVLPKRDVESEGSFFIQPLRYWWELGLWRFRFATPPVLSSCWGVKSTELEAVGGFEGIKKAVEPEAVFAKKFAVKSKYSFFVANKAVGVTSIKAPKEQYQTALRTRYVQLRRQPESVFAAIFYETVFLLGPFIIGPWALLNGRDDIAIASLISVLLLSLANASVYRLSLRYLWPAGFITAPLLIIADWILLLKSLYAYEFDEVIWKERNICIPLLTVEDHLPRI